MNSYYLKTDKNLTVCVISSTILLSALFKADGKWVEKKIANGKRVNCYQLEIELSKFGITGLEVFVDNNYFLQPKDD